MAATVVRVMPDSICDELGLKPGDQLLEMNGHPVGDVLDFMFYQAAEELSLLMLIDGEKVLYEIEKDSEEPLGIDFEDYLMDQQLQ